MAEKVVVLFSGGWESTLCLQRVVDAGRQPLALFFDYGQPFLAEEADAVQCITRLLQVPLVYEKLRISSGGGALFLGRNLRFLLKAVDQYAPAEVYIGARAPCPVFDPYGDSNSITLRSIGRACGVRVRTLPPYPKWLVRGLVHRALRPLVWSSENWNKSQELSK